LKNHRYNNNNSTDIKRKKVLDVLSEIEEIAKKNIEKAGLSDRIEVITGDALEIIPKLNNHYRFDMVFIDAVKNQYLKYLKLVEESDLMNKEVAVVIADNVLIYENEMKDYLEYVRNSGLYNSYTTETTLEFTKNVKDALEVSLTANMD
jgi:predicted O-methyltransferase YrrM